VPLTRQGHGPIRVKIASILSASGGQGFELRVKRLRVPFLISEYSDIKIDSMKRLDRLHSQLHRLRLELMEITVRLLALIGLVLALSGCEDPVALHERQVAAQRAQDESDAYWKRFHTPPVASTDNTCGFCDYVANKPPYHGASRWTVGCADPETLMLVKSEMGGRPARVETHARLAQIRCSLIPQSTVIKIHHDGKYVGQSGAVDGPEIAYVAVGEGREMGTFFVIESELVRVR